MFPALPITAEWHATRPGSDEPLTSADGVRVQRAIETQGDGFRIRVRFVNGSGGPVLLHSLSPAVIEGECEWFADGLEGWSVWLQGRDMNAGVLTHRFAPGEQQGSLIGSFRAPADDGVSFRSDGMTLLHQAGGGRNLLIGFVTTARQFGEVIVTCAEDEQALRRIEARCLIEAKLIEDGGVLESESVVLLAGAEPLSLTDDYAGILAASMRARVPDRVPSGWSSWYFYGNRVTERDVFTNLIALQTGGYRVDYVQIDDGYQAAVGDWLAPNERFPRGLRFLADRIRDAGYRPDLWLAPLVMHRDSRVLAERPPFALHDQDGAIIWSDTWLGRCATLDCTHPGAAAWLHEVIRTVVQEWGYRMLKLDALAFACQPHARHHAVEATSAINLRAGLQIIRAAAGDDTYILGCTCPFGPAIGLVDAMRVGPDVDARWSAGTRPSVKQALRPALQRFWMHRRLWLNDPDCLVMRRPESALSEDEARFLATGIALSGGPTMLADNLTDLPSGYAAIAQRILPPAGVAARPLDLFEREPPAIWRVPRADGGVLAFLNWSDGSIDLTVNLAEAGLDDATSAVERWRDEARDPDPAFTERDIAPHAPRVVRFARTDLPADPDAHLLA